MPDRELDGRAENAFSYGACGGLAMALHQSQGWPLVKVTDAHSVWGDDGWHMQGRSPEERAQIGKAGMGAGGIHWLAQRPDGMLVDVDGAHHPGEVIDQWDGNGDEEAEGEVGLGYTDLADAQDEYREKGEPMPMDEVHQYVPAVLRRAQS